MNKLKEILNQTLKRNDKWSSTLLTMFSAWVWCLLFASIDYFRSGYRADVFFAMIGMAGGIKITDSFSKKLKPNEN
jgi:hypothetical protein